MPRNEKLAALAALAIKAEIRSIKQARRKIVRDHDALLGTINTDAEKRRWAAARAVLHELDKIDRRIARLRARLPAGRRLKTEN